MGLEVVFISLTPLKLATGTVDKEIVFEGALFGMDVVVKMTECGGNTVTPLAETGTVIDAIGVGAITGVEVITLASARIATVGSFSFSGEIPIETMAGVPSIEPG